MAGQLAAAATIATNSSLLLPPSLLRPPSLRNEDLIPQRRVTFSRKKIPTVKALASSSLGKSATRLTAVSSPLSTDNRGHLSFSVPKGLAGSSLGKSATRFTAVSSPLSTDNRGHLSLSVPKALAGSSLGKSATRFTAVSSPLSTDNRGHLSLSVPKGLAGSSLGKSATRLTAVSSPLSTDNHGFLSLSVPKSRRSSSSTRPQAYIYHWSGFRIPANAEKPEWWWRTLSCIPYLIALQMSATGYYLEPLLDKFKLFENVIFYIPGAVNRLPAWFPILYCYLAIVVVVKNKDFPLIFRFHLMTGMLLEIALQIVWVASNFLPLIHFKGTLGMYYWAAVALTYIIITMHSIRCALLGTFSNIPVISESAFLHSLFSLGGFQRPF